MLQEQGKEDDKEGGSKDAFLLYFALDVKGVGHAALVLDGCLHVIMEGSDELVEFWGATNLWEDVEELLPADQVEGTTRSWSFTTTLTREMAL